MYFAVFPLDTVNTDKIKTNAKSQVYVYRSYVFDWTSSDDIHSDLASKYHFWFIFHKSTETELFRPNENSQRARTGAKIQIHVSSIHILSIGHSNHIYSKLESNYHLDINRIISNVLVNSAQGSPADNLGMVPKVRYISLVTRSGVLMINLTSIQILIQITYFTSIG